MAAPPLPTSPWATGATFDQAVEVNYQPNKQNPRIPVEVLTGDELARRMPARHNGRLQRLRFHLLIVCSQGEGGHDIDFTHHTLGPGSVLHVRPGQAQRFTNVAGISTDLLLWPDELQPGAAQWFPGSQTPTSFQASTSELTDLRRWIGDMRTEQQHFIQSPQRSDLLRAMLLVVLRKIDTLSNAPVAPTPFPPLYIELRELLERRVLDRPSAALLAAEIGYSTRTLDRASIAATNQTVKQVIDERIGLELRRRLADRSRSLSSIRDDFGFIDSSAFAKFARRHVGEPPSTFRARFE